MNDDTRTYAVVMVVEAASYDEARKMAPEGRVVGVPWPVNMGGDEDAIRLIDQHPEADF